ncbi:MAG: cell division protein FtsX [Cytophagales bacterium]
MAIKRKTLGSYPYLSVLFSITMALFVIGLFGLLVIYANRLSILIKENIELHIYTDYNLDENSNRRIVKFINQQAYLQIKDGQKQLYFISKEDAAKKFVKETGEDFINFLGENPLRDSYVIKINPDYSSKNTLRLIKTQLEKQDGIFEVIYIESIIDAINKNIAKISLVLLGFAFVLIIVVFVLINSSLRLALYSQRFLIRSMKLVGATSFFIQIPFLSRAFFHGILGGLFASALLSGMVYYAYSQIPELQILENREQMLILAAVLVAFGGVLGFASSFRALNRYMRMSLNDLF